MTVLAIVAAAVVVLLLTPAKGRSQLQRLSPNQREKNARIQQVLIWMISILSGLVILTLIGGVALLGWGVAALIVLGTAGGIGWRTHADRSARAANREVVCAARGLAGQLRIGQVPAVALLEMAKDCAVLRHAADVQRIGGDVVGALRADAAGRGLSGLADLAAAWELCGRTGAPVADAVDAVAESLRHAEYAQDAVSVEAAAARTTGRVMAVLPIAGLGLGYLAGGDPVAFLTSGLVGEAFFVAGLALAATGVLWLEWLADRACRE